MINETNKDAWCVNAFHGMSGNNDGSTKMCCMIKKEYQTMNNSSTSPIRLFLGESSIKSNFDNASAQRIRANLEQGVRDDACGNCWQEEDGGRKSKRMRDNEKYLHHLAYGGKPHEGLAIFELNLGNTCNIKCRTCHATISSQWMKEDYDLNHSNTTYKEYSMRMRKYHKTYDEESPFWDDLEANLSTIRQFDFYGGEPFLSKKMWEVLRICVEKGYAKDIELHYNTNGTIWPAEAELFKHFRSVNLSFSIDGTGEQFEFMRYLAKWDEVKANMRKASEFRKQFPQMQICWCITLSSLNIYNLPEVLDEYYKNYTDFGLYLNLVHGPDHFNISHMPQDIKDVVVKRLESINKDYVSAWHYLPGIIGFIQNGQSRDDLWDTFKTTVSRHDEYREQDFYSIFEEFGKVVTAHG